MANICQQNKYYLHQVWSDKLKQILSSSTNKLAEYIKTIGSGCEGRIDELSKSINANSLINEIEALRNDGEEKEIGLAQFLAENGPLTYVRYANTNQIFICRSKKCL